MGLGKSKMGILMGVALGFFAYHIPHISKAMDVMTVATGNLAHNEKLKGRVTGMYQGLNINVEFHQLPLQRSLVEANRGAHDAELARIKGMEQDFLNLVRVPEPVLK